MRSAIRTICPSSVAGTCDPVWPTIPSRTSQVRLRPLPSYSSLLDDAQRLHVVPVPGRSSGASCVVQRAQRVVERRLARVPERRVAEIVAERDRLGQVLVERQRAGDRARDLRHLERVRQPRPVVVALGREEHLRLVREPPKRLAVDDAVAVALELGAIRVERDRPRRARASRRRRPRGARSAGALRPRGPRAS